MPERRPRVLLASGAVGDVTPRQAAVALARGFAGAADVAVIGLADGGRALGRALAEPDGEFEELHTGWLARRDDLVAVGAESAPTADRAQVDRAPTDQAPTDLAPVDRVAGGRVAGDPLTGGSADLGRLVGYALSDAPAGTLAIDLTDADVHDAGAGLLGALGAVADVPLDAGPEPLAALTRLDLDAVRARLGGCELVGLVPAGQEGDLLLGLRGITSRRGRALGTPAERMLALDDALERFASAAAGGVARQPGAGASGGLGFAILALGGRLTTPAAFCAETSGLERPLAAADLVVTACDSFDFGSRGGGVVTELARRCEAVQTPLVVVSPVVGMSGREMRVMGVESAHPLEPAADTAAALTMTGARLAAGWTPRW